MQTIKIKLSKPSKMPGFSFALPAQECKIGGKLRDVPGSVCSKCYACKGAYVWPVVKKVRYDNLEQITSDHWVGAMIDEITKKTKKIPFFRWHDSGDLQSSEHFQKIIAIAEALPAVNFWLPTKEKKIVNVGYRDGGEGMIRWTNKYVYVPIYPGLVAALLPHSLRFACRPQPLVVRWVHTDRLQRTVYRR